MTKYSDFPRSKTGRRASSERVAVGKLRRGSVGASLFLVVPKERGGATCSSLVTRMAARLSTRIFNDERKSLVLLIARTLLSISLFLSRSLILFIATAIHKWMRSSMRITQEGTLPSRESDSSMGHFLGRGYDGGGASDACAFRRMKEWYGIKKEKLSRANLGLSFTRIATEIQNKLLNHG